MSKAAHHHLRTALAACACVGLLSAGAFATPVAAAPRKAASAKPARMVTPSASETVTRFADRVIASHDNGGLPFVVVDKRQAAVFVYRPDGNLNAATPALLGYAAGDGSVPGIGKRPLSKIKAGERTTPAGRFLTAFRPNGRKTTVLWVEYETAVALHPLRQLTSAGSKAQRLRRLKSPSPADNRVTYGCINVPDAFFDEVVTPAFAQRGGIVYILPETRALGEVFPSLGQGLTTHEAAAAPKEDGRKPS